MLDAVLERITYANEETGYTIARVATDRSGADLLTVVGALLGVQPGESLRLVGRWGSHPRYGRQFEVDSYTTVLPATIQGIERYLGSGLIKGIGPRTAGRIVGHFGVDTLRVIEEQPAAAGVVRLAVRGPPHVVHDQHVPRRLVPGDAPLDVGEATGAGGQGGLELEPLDGDGPAVHPAQRAAAFEGGEVAADGLRGHAEGVGEQADLDPAGLTGLRHDPLLPLRCVHRDSLVLTGGPSLGRCRVSNHWIGSM